MLNIGILGCKGTTLDLASSLTGSKVPIKCIITLDEHAAERNKVANAASRNLLEFAGETGIASVAVDDYSLRDEKSIQYFEDLRLDLLLVIGWERLLPTTILKSIRLFACGMHGSSYGLPYGRGRSPLNWSLITGQRKFVTYLFRYTPGMDDGDILGFRVFDINEYDDIGSLHQKNRIAMSELILECLPTIEDGSIQFWNQPAQTPTFYPRRTEDDGLVDWTASPTAICRFVRALAPPYPSAFTVKRGVRISVQDAVPFDTTLGSHLLSPGTVLDVSESMKTFVVQASGGSVLVRQHSSLVPMDIRVGDKLESDDWRSSSKKFEERYGMGVRPEQMEIRGGQVYP